MPAILLAKTKATALALSTDLVFDEPDSATILTVPDGAGELRLCIAVSAASKMFVRHNAVNLVLLADTALRADTLYTFTLELAENETFSIQSDTTMTIRFMTITWVSGEVS